MSGLKGKTVVLGITGGIAAYKAAELCRLLVKAGATVRVVMTDAATQFIAPLTLQTLSGASVARELFDLDEEARIGHIRLGDEADLIVIAPATANAIARLSAGMADDLLTAVVLASRAPVLLAPAMNVNMWQNPITQQNLGRLVALGRFSTVGPDAGALACGWIGPGRLIEPAVIAEAAARLLGPRDLTGRKIVVTAGPTHEPVDDVRFLGNRSSGKMGFALAAAAARRGAEVTLIAGPVALETPIGGGITRRDVETAAELRAALASVAATADAVVMAAAVADFRPAARIAGKLSRRAQAIEQSNGQTREHGIDDGELDARAAASASAPTTLPLVANPDLLAELGRARKGAGRPNARPDARPDARPFLVGFAAETGRDAAGLLARARQKLASKGCDVVVANDVGAPGIGFGSDDNAVTLVFADGSHEALTRAPKLALAEAIWDRLVPRLPGGERPVQRPRAARRQATSFAPVLRGARGRGRRA